MSTALCWEEPVGLYASLRAFCLNIPIFYYIIDYHTAVQLILENDPQGIYFMDYTLKVATLVSVYSSGSQPFFPPGRTMVQVQVSPAARMSFTYYVIKTNQPDL